MKKTNIIDIITTINDIKVLAQTLIYTGCDINCLACHNKSLQIEQEGLTLTHIEIELKKRRKLTDILVHAGAEPLNSPETFLKISGIASSYNYTQVLFSGRDVKDVLHFSPKYLENIDYVKVGPYQINNRVDGYHFASSNQILYRVECGYIFNKIYYVDDNNNIKGNLPF